MAPTANRRAGLPLDSLVPMDNSLLFIAAGIFVVLIVGEFLYGLAKRRNNYRLNDALSSLGLGALSQVVAVFTQFFQIGLYELVYPTGSAWHHTAFWHSWLGWLLAVLLYDFLAYWAHRTSHESALLWAAHAPHHQSQCFNLSTALRQESFYPVTTCVFFLPLALLGLPPDEYALVSLGVLVYQFWVHTEHIGSLGWFDRVFTSPSNHRVHHAVNGPYLDKNYGDLLVVWDRLFGTYQAEQQACVYGTTTPLNSWNPLWAHACVAAGLLTKARQQPRWTDKLRVFFKPPGWQEGPPPPSDPGGAAARVYDPPVTLSRQWSAAALFLFTVATLVAYLLVADALSLGPRLVGGLLIGLALWAVGRLLTRPTSQAAAPR